MKKVLIGVATRGCDVYYRLCMWLMHQGQLEDVDVDILFSQCPVNAASAQSVLFLSFLRHDYNYLMLVDTDVCPGNLNALSLMVADDKEIVTLPVWHFCPKTYDVHLNVHRTRDMERVYTFPEDCSGVEKIHSSSFACILIKREVIEGFIKARQDPVRYSPLLPIEFEHGFSDNIFFAKSALLGFDVWVDWRVQNTVHYRPVALENNSLDSFLSHAKKGKEIGVRCITP